MSSDSYAAILVTFRRPEALRSTLESVIAQEPCPGLIVVADNDPHQSAQDTVLDAQTRTKVPIIYLPTGENLGPAGGWAAAAEAAAAHKERGQWLLVVDDDDPLVSPQVARHLLDTAEKLPSNVGAVGLRGARLNRLKIRLERDQPSRGDSAVVDYLASGGAPVYRWAAVDRVGFFDPLLFFGFEDLDLGFRMANEGWSMVVAPAPHLYEVLDTGAGASAWREYYKTRAVTWIFLQNLGLIAALVHGVRSVLFGGALLAVRSKSPALWTARIHGAIDGSRGRLGVRRYHPPANPPKEVVR